MDIVEVNTKDIILYEKNIKEHPKEQIDKIKKSIKEFGFNVPILLTEKNVVIAGHGRVLAAIQLGMEKIPAIYKKDLTDAQIKAYRIADNKTAESDWKYDFLKDEFEDLMREGFDMDLTGFDKEEVDRILDNDANVDEDDFDTEKAVQNPHYKIEEGDVYELGKHKIVCGDATNPDAYKALLGNERVKLCITSPPYNMAGDMYEDYTDDLKSEEYIKLHLKAINCIKNNLMGFLFWNLSYNKNARWEFLEIAHRIMKDTGLKFMELIVWNKKHAMPISSEKMLTRQYEDILAFGNEEAIQEDLELYYVGANDGRAYFNKKTQRGITNYWEIGTLNTQTEFNKACFPVNLPAKAIKLMTDRQDIVIDPFGGSGTTIIACEQLQRKGRMIELDPKYCSAIIERWEKFTGSKAKKL